jgi:hypothetical protein
MTARGDTEEYQAGLTLLENFLLTPQGPLTKRPGTFFAGEVNAPAFSSPMYPFAYSAAEGYAMEFASGKIRFWKNGALLTEAAKAVSGIVGDTVTATAHGYSVGDQVYLSGFTSAPLVNGRVFTIATVPNVNSFTITGLGAASGAGSSARIYTIAHTFSDADLPYLRMEQSADTVFITNVNYQPKVLVRASETSWTISDYTFRDGPYENINADGVTLTPSGTTGSITLTASAVTGINNDTGFQTTDVGRLVRLKDPSTGNWTWADITARSSTTIVTVTIQGADLSGTTAVTSWRLGIWSGTTGWPSCVRLYEDRLVFAGGVLTPHRIAASETGDYYTHSPTEVDGTVVASNGINVQIAAKDNDTISWIINDQNGLLVGSASNESVIRAARGDEALSATNISVTTATGHGSDVIDAIRAGKSTLFFQRGKTVLQGLSYSADLRGYSSAERTLVANHVTEGGVLVSAFNELPMPILWSVRADGQLLGLTLKPDSGTIGWHRHPFKNGVVEQVCVVPSSTNRLEDVYLVVKRTINGATVRYVEVLDRPWAFDSVKETANFADCSILYSGTATTSITGLWWLEGETVSILAGGARHADKVVTGGAVTLDRSVTQARMGYNITSKMQTMPLLGGSAEGTGRGKLKRHTHVAFDLYESFGGDAGPQSGDLEELPMIEFGFPPDAAMPLVTKEVKVPWQEGYETAGRVYLEHADLFPLTLLGVYPRSKVEDGG